MLFDEAFLRKLEGLRLAARRAVNGRREGERLTRKRGGSSEFVSHRPYAQGDDLRAIDWNLYGRLGQLYVKEFAREEALPVRIAVDTTSSMAPKFDYARRLAAALAMIANEESPAVRLPDIEALTVGAPFAIPGTSRGLLILVSDLWDDGLRAELMKSRCEKAVVHVLAPEEVDPPYAGKVRLVDAETGEARTRFVGEDEKRDYARLLAEHCAAWKTWCFDREINYVRCASSTPLEEVVRVWLRESGVIE
ncbi:MAG TPA: DUF58 domain-containing protein [Planctomycetota bacterium]